MELVVILALVGYAIYRAVQFAKYKKYRIMPRVQVQELAAHLVEEANAHPGISRTCAATAITGHWS